MTTTPASIAEKVERCRTYAASGATIPLAARRSALTALDRAIRAHKSDIEEALHADLGKTPTEGYMCEIGLTLAELRYQLHHVGRWARRHRVRTDLANLPGRSFTIAEPYGVVLIMSPWNYPFMLTMEPLVGALAAGNTCVVKPSAYAPATSAVIRQIVESCLPPELATVVEGGRAENTELLDQRFDYIFFTGSVAVGRLVMQRAAEHLTPVTLELGGKSPCIVAADANLSVTAARVVFGKFLNCGQTCVAPDYVLVDERVHDAFLSEVERQINKMFGERPLENPAWGKIINRKHFDRLLGLIDPSKVVTGGGSCSETLQIEPTVMDGVTAEDAVMGEEIFGPILPVITYRSVEEAEALIKARPKPLALYLFTRDRALEDRLLRYVPFGGGCINDTIVHLATSEMGFGGVGASGMGSYHGKKSFDTFSHEKSILKRSLWADPPMRYQPYARWKDRLIRLVLS